MRFSVLWTRSGPCGRGTGPEEPMTGMAAAARSVERLDGHLEVVAGGGDHV
jgi:hypothetical protein